MIIRTAYTYVSGVDALEFPEGVSLTTPDMSMSLKTLVDRYTRSGDPGEFMFHNGVYDGDVEVPHFDRMTPQERLDYARNIKGSIVDWKKSRDEMEKEAIEAKAKADAEVIAASSPEEQPPIEEASAI